MGNTEINLPDNVKEGIAKLAEKCGMSKVILFGSRARGDNRERSDIDIAVIGGDTLEFACSIDEDIETLLMFDIVDLSGPVQEELLENIKRDGIVIYEKV